VAALQFVIAVIAVIVGVEVLVLVPAAILSKLEVASGAVTIGASIALAIAGFTAAVFALRRVPRGVVEFITRAPAGRFNGVLLAIAVGLVLRVAIMLVSQVAPQSDAKVYTEMAGMLAAGKPFFYTGRWAYWPIGYPSLLSLWFRIGGGSMFGLHVLNLLLYVALSFGVWRLCKSIVQPAAGRLAVWILALWPDLIALSSWPSKELVVLALLPWCVAYAIDPVTTTRATLIKRVAAGVLGGLAVLVQPSFILLVPVVPAFGWLARTQSPRAAFATAAVLILTAAATIAPWTARNYRVLGAFVPVATNGGEVLYRANNPLATGEYVKVGEVDLWVLPELEAHRQGMALAKQWIAAHPKEFVVLAGRKQAYFLEDDAIGVYESFNRGHVGEPVPIAVYFLLKAACNAFWWLLWAVLAACLVLTMRDREGRGTAVVILLPFLYLYGIHSIFESGPRYHQPGDPFVAVCAAVLLVLALTRGRAAAQG
jgi:hypothetical protein